MTLTTMGLSLQRISESWCLTCLSTGMFSCRMCSQWSTTKVWITSTRVEWHPQRVKCKDRSSGRGSIMMKRVKTSTITIGLWTRRRLCSLPITYSRVALRAAHQSIWTLSSMSTSTKLCRRKCSILSWLSFMKSFQWPPHFLDWSRSLETWDREETRIQAR